MKSPNIFKLLITILCLLGSMIVNAQNFPGGFTGTKIANLNAPVSMTIAPDGRLFLLEQAGNVKIYKNGSLLGGNLVTMDSIFSGLEKGLLGVVLDPDFSNNHYIYFFYTVSLQGDKYNGVIMPGTPIRHKITRYTMNGDLIVNGSKTTIKDLGIVGSFQAGVNHDGGKMQFGPDGKLYVATGDGDYWCSSDCANPLSTSCDCGPTWIPPYDSRDLNSYLGKILRINSDGSAPSDNPFHVNSLPGNAVQQYIYAIGFRNPFHFTFKPGTSDIYIGDVGSEYPAARDEVNKLTPTGLKNFGWRNTLGGNQEGFANEPGLADPIICYNHDPDGSSSITTSTGCAIVGVVPYMPATTNWPTKYFGKIFYMDFCNGWINTIDENNGNTIENFATGLAFNPANSVSGVGAIVPTVDQSTGNFFYLVRSPNAALSGVYKVSYTPPVSVTGITISTTSNIMTACGSGLQFNASTTDITWSTFPSTGIASISVSGFLTALNNGVVTVIGRANSNYSIMDTKVITISGVSPASSISITTAGNNFVINNYLGSLQFGIVPSAPTSCSLLTNWAIKSKSAVPLNGSISSSGLLSVTSGEGIFTISGSLLSNPSVIAYAVVTVTNQCNPSVTGLLLSSFGNNKIISTNKGSLQLTTTYFPTSACTGATWSFLKTGNALVTISSTGLISSLGGNGVVTITATSILKSSVSANFVITISSQVINVDSIKVYTQDGLNSITDENALQMLVNIFPSFANNKALSWSVTSITGMAIIDASTGILSGITNGTVLVKATSVSNPLATSTLVVTISGQTTSIADLNSNEEEILVFPNPNSGIFTVKIGPKLGTASIFVTNEAGALVYSNKLGRFSGYKNIDLSALPKGFYKVTIEGEQAVYHQKIVIQ